MHFRLNPQLTRIIHRGNLIFVAGVTLAVTALSLAEVKFPWLSAPFFVLLVVGILLISAFVLYEKFVPAEPAIPWDVMKDMTCLGG